MADTKEIIVRMISLKSEYRGRFEGWPKEDLIRNCHGGKTWEREARHGNDTASARRKIDQ